MLICWFPAGNPCCPDQLTQSRDHDLEDYSCYRLYVISQLSFLDFLDSSRITKEERNRARQIGKFQVVRSEADDFDISISRIGASLETVYGKQNSERRGQFSTKSSSCSRPQSRAWVSTDLQTRKSFREVCIRFRTPTVRDKASPPSGRESSVI